MLRRFEQRVGRRTLDDLARIHHGDLVAHLRDHADPLAELARLEAVSRERWVHFSKLLPSKRNPVGIIDRAELDARVAAALAEAK